MKKILIYLSLILALQLNAQTNVYHPMLSDTSVEWTFVDCYYQCYYHKVKICGTITHTNNEVYFILCDWVFQGNGNPYTFLYQDTLALTREDIVNKKVYGIMKFYNGLDTIERLLYDFDSIYIGKPLNTYFQSFMGTPDTIKCIDSVQLMNGTYRIFFTNDYYCGNPASNAVIGMPATIILGIGNITNPFTYWGQIACLNQPCPYRALVCYKKNNNILWQDFLASPPDICNVVLSVEGKEQLTPEIKLFPSIASDYFYIYPPIKDGNLCVEIYSTSGQLVSKLNNNTSGYFDVSNINDGFYLVKINYKEHISYHKIIVKH